MQIRMLLLVVMALSFTDTAMSANYSWIYANGAYSWPGDYSYGASADYWDKSGGPLSGSYDIKVTVSGKWGEWQPYASNGNFNTDAYGYFTVALKPTRANQSWQAYFTKVNARAGKAVNLANYGAAPRVGIWATYTIPLSAFGISDASVGSFSIQDTTGLAENIWYVDNVGFDSAATVGSTPAVLIPKAAVAATAPVSAVSTQSSTSGVASVVFEHGVFNWPGSFSYGVVLDYSDTTGTPMSGAYDLRVQLTEKWGAWQPYALNFNFNAAPYTKLTFSLKPTVSGQIWQMYFMMVHDVPTGKVLNITDFGPAPVAGKWATYSIPLADVGIVGTSVYKFAIQDETGLSSNTWYVDNVQFE